MPRLPLSLTLAATLSLGFLRPILERPHPRATDCSPEGRGIPPLHWLGCAADPGTPRALAGDERLSLGLPIDPNLATAAELSFVPGLSRSLGAAIIADRAARGPFPSVDSVVRVRGIGPVRLARARSALVVDPAP